VYKRQPLQLPVILATDPVVKTIGAKPGDIIRITRKGKLGQTFYYRRVV